MHVNSFGLVIARINLILIRHGDFEVVLALEPLELHIQRHAFEPSLHLLLWRFDVEVALALEPLLDGS